MRPRPSAPIVTDVKPPTLPAVSIADTVAAVHATSEKGANCFILPAQTRKGLGKRFLDRVIEDAKRKGVATLLANMSSLNEQSLNFHRNNGFDVCGRFECIGRKFGNDFDVMCLRRFI